MHVVLISLVLGQRIPISFISLHDGSSSLNSREDFRQGELSKAMLEIILFLIFFHALELLTESAIDVIEISGNVGKLCIAVLFVKNHPQVKTQVAVTPMVCDVFAKVFCVFQPSQGVFN